ncbi:GGDEF domain-containing protein [Gordonia sp. TBRC 11910]|uniref:GGDEF domain-containing protein n=1 Tax=Gordonia asplenii TaxID=2725283 RepID=A0A848L7Q2_9ACTN|nr:GGDEF domain-containing protein [Gordonia asplenii]NMO04501.1 GGDEF domain-containing protein [Gordonia asplenii]
MALDSRTLWIAIAVAAMIIGSLLVSQSLLQRRERSALLWGVGMLIGALGSAFIGLRSQLPALVSITLANGLITLSWAVIAAGLRSFNAQPLRWAIVWAVPIAQMTVFEFASVVHDHIAARTAVGGVCFAGMIAWAVIDAARAQQQEKLLWRRGLIAVMVMWILTTAARIIASVFAHQSTDPSVNSVAQTVTALGLMALVVTTGVIVTLMSRERIDNWLAESAHRDFQTATYNRAGLFEVTAEILHKAHATSASNAVLLMDLDEFKSINDRFGHAAGDMVIVEFAQVAARELSANDVLARYGGEEFCAIVCGSTDIQAAAVAERIRQRFAAHPIVYGSTVINCTVSIGVSPLAHTDESLHAAIGAADLALYAAKSAGRNVVQVFAGSRFE